MDGSETSEDDNSMDGFNDNSEDGFDTDDNMQSSESDHEYGSDDEYGSEESEDGHPISTIGFVSGLLLMQTKLEVRTGNHVVLKRNDLAEDTQARAAEREAQLERFKRCRFQEGFASEGMLCNSPPIPLRVLDYLEAADLLSLSLVCKATHQASHYLFHREEECLSQWDMWVPSLGPSRNSVPARHRAMRAVSLMCGRPEAFNIRCFRPSLLHNLVSSPDACTQPHARWDNLLLGHTAGLTELVRARIVAVMGQRRRLQMFQVDPEGWPDREQEAVAELRRTLRENILELRAEEDWSHSDEGKEETTLDLVDKVFDAACRHRQPVIYSVLWRSDVW